MNTPTPKTDKAWSCFSGYTEPLQDVKDLSHDLERELTAVTEQRDRLAEVIEAASVLIAAKGRHNTMLAYNGLRDALQSLTPNEPISK